MDFADSFLFINLDKTIFKYKNKKIMRVLGQLCMDSL